MKKLDIIVPVYNEEEAIPYFYKEIKGLDIGLDIEIIFVDDGSTDKTLELIKEYTKKDEKIKYITFSRNFGKESAMYAGLKLADADYTVIMDVDLQDPPSLIPVMYQAIKEGYDMVATRRTTRKGEPKIRSFFARKFYKLINKLSKTEMVDGARDFRFMTRQVVDSVLEMAEYNRYSKGLFSFVGFKTKWIDYENKERVAGKTKWSFWGLFIYACDAITSFSTTPLVIAALIGIIFCIIAFLMIIFIIVRTLIFGDPVNGWPSMVCIIIFVSGIQLFCIGIIGQYLSKTYLEVKKRPIYIIKDTNISKK